MCAFPSKPKSPQIAPPPPPPPPPAAEAPRPPALPDEARDADSARDALRRRQRGRAALRIPRDGPGLNLPQD